MKDLPFETWPEHTGRGCKHCGQVREFITGYKQRRFRSLLKAFAAAFTAAAVGLTLARERV